MRLALLAALSLSVVSVANAQQVKPVPSLAERVEKLETVTKGLDWRVTEVDSRAGEFSARIHCDTGNFSQILAEQSTLTFLVVCEKIEPFLEGYRLTLAIGNPYSMRFTVFSVG